MAGFVTLFYILIFSGENLGIHCAYRVEKWVELSVATQMTLFDLSADLWLISTSCNGNSINLISNNICLSLKIH